MCYIVPGKFYCISSICPVSCPAPSISSKFLCFIWIFKEKGMFAQNPLGSSSANCFHRAPGSSVKKLVPAELILGASSECADHFFFPYRNSSVIRNPELSKHSISKGRNSEIERKGESVLGAKGRGVLFKLKSLRPDMAPLHKTSRKVSADLGDKELFKFTSLLA